MSALSRLGRVAFDVTTTAAGTAVRTANTALDSAEALVRLPGTVVETVEEMRAAARTLRRVGERADGLLDDIEAPLRAAAPGLRRLADILEDPIVAEAPETVRRVLDEVLPALRTIRDTQQRMATIATSTDRLTGAAAAFMRRATRPVDRDDASPPEIEG